MLSDRGLILKERSRRRWQDTRPPEAELRNSYAIADRHVDRFSALFPRVLGRIIDREPFIDAFARGQLEDSVRSIAWDGPAWDGFNDSLVEILGSIVLESGRAEQRRLKLPFSFDVVKILNPPPPNPFSLDWIFTQSADLVKTISNSTQQGIRLRVSRAFEQGIRADRLLSEIENDIGLLDREHRAVERRKSLLLDEGVSEKRADAMARRYAKQLLRKRINRIARTETANAQAQGQHDAWRLGIESGDIDRSAQREWVAAGFSARTCPICLELDGKVVSVSEPFDSAIVGTVMRPPAHVMCRCTTALVLP